MVIIITTGQLRSQEWHLTAIKFGLLLALIGFMATLLQSKVGSSGVYLLLDVAARGILLAGLVNSLIKGLLALMIGGRKLGLRVLLPYLVSIALILPLL